MLCSAHGYSDGSSSLSFELLLTQPTSEPGSREIHGYEPSFLSDRVSDEASWGRGLARPRKPVVERSAGRATPSGRRASQDAKRNPACVVSGPVVHSVSNSPVAEAALRARDNPGERRSDVGGGLSLGARWEVRRVLRRVRTFYTELGQGDSGRRRWRDSSVTGGKRRCRGYPLARAASFLGSQRKEALAKRRVGPLLFAPTGSSPWLVRAPMSRPARVIRAAPRVLDVARSPAVVPVGPTPRITARIPEASSPVRNGPSQP
ncbi:hypothetical protein HPB47_027476 [Ixodes persulcatus]|uniref:Uncharacterized protein n=1 Tax=Ixodes persulcatus TaxID=34615 RepID=A0AC60PWB4_IXOPE|nr:hypothetical protein HPB47_027476 [Ixodes persulcatus]